MFVLRLSRSGRAIHRIYPTRAQEAFLEGHIEAFRDIGGVPTKHVRYDNLTSAVTAVVFGQGQHRVENERLVLFRSAFDFDAFYCQPGITGAHDKGGVESEVGWVRRNRLSPMPAVESLDELNDRIRAREEQDQRRRISDRIRTIGEDFTAEHAFLGAFSGRKLRPWAATNPQSRPILDDHSPDGQVISPGTAHGRKMRISLRTSEIIVFDGNAVVARRARLSAKGGIRSSSITTWKSSKPNLAPSRSSPNEEQTSSSKPLPREAGESVRRDRLKRILLRLDESLHRSHALRGHCRPAHVQRRHHRNRNRLLPPSPHHRTPGHLTHCGGQGLPLARDNWAIAGSS